MIDDTFMLYALGVAVDRPTFEALLADQDRWEEYLKLCRKRGPSVQRTVASHRGSAWHLVMSHTQVHAQEGAYMPEPVPPHPAISLLNSLGDQATKETQQLMSAEVYTFSREKPILADLVQAGAFVRKLAAKKSAAYRQALCGAAAKALKERATDLLKMIFTLKEGKVVYATRRNHIIFRVGGQQRLQYEPGDAMPVPGKVYLSIDPVKVEGASLTATLEILRPLSPPGFLELEPDSMAGGFHLVMPEPLACKLLEEAKACS